MTPEERITALEGRVEDLEAFRDLVQRTPALGRELQMHQNFIETRRAEQRTENTLAARREAGRPAREEAFKRFAAERLVVDGRPDRATTQGHVLLCYREWADAQRMVASDRLDSKELATCVLKLPGVRQSRGMNHCRAVVDVVLGVCIQRAFRQSTDRFNGPSIIAAEHEELRRQEQAAKPKRPAEEVLYG